MKVALVFAASLTAAAVYSSATSAAPDVTNDQAPVPPSRYQSPFRDYRPLGEDKLLPWKAANDEVARIGGWRAYAKEAREAPTTAAPPAAAPSGSTMPSAQPAPNDPPSPKGIPAAKSVPGHAGHGQPKEDQKK